MNDTPKPTDGGPAFPRPDFHSDTHYTAPAQDGMSLRDYFATKAPIGIHDAALLYGMPLEDIMRDADHWNAFLAMFTETRFDYADAMLAARSKEGP